MALTTASVSTTAQAAIGTTLTVVTSHRGNQVWVYILNEGAALSEGEVLMRNTTSTEYRGVVATAATLIPAIRVIGVAQHAIPANSYGYVLRTGVGSILVGSGAGVSDTNALTTAGVEAGSVIAFAAGTTAPMCVFGVAVANISASATGNAYFNCLG